jgi:hypothetical protein
MVEAGCSKFEGPGVFDSTAFVNASIQLAAAPATGANASTVGQEIQILILLSIIFIKQNNSTKDDPCTGFSAGFL